MNKYPGLYQLGKLLCSIAAALLISCQNQAPQKEASAIVKTAKTSILDSTCASKCIADGMPSRFTRIKTAQHQHSDQN